MSTPQIEEPRELSLHGSLSFLGYSADVKLTKEKWIEDGAALATMDKALRFAIGDWVLFGESRYGEEHAQAIDATALSYSSINSARWVASRIPERRRRPKLSWSHHEAVAALDPDAQDEVLDLAVKKKLDRDQTREIVRARKGLPEPEEMVYLPKTKVERLEAENEYLRERITEKQGEVKAIEAPKDDYEKLPKEQTAEMREGMRYAPLDFQERYSKRWNDPL